MSRAFFTGELETAVTYWRIWRRDGTALAFTGHDRDLWLAGIMHRAAPGMVPSALRLGGGFDADSAEVSGVLAHDAISEADLAAGRYDQAAIEMGVLDWASGDALALFAGTLGSVSASDGGFHAELHSAKQLLERDLVPRTSPTCRAAFCGPGCQLSAARFTLEAELAAFDLDTNACQFAAIAAADYVFGELLWIDGPQAGLRSAILAVGAQGLVLAEPLAPSTMAGQRARLRQGCDRTLTTCHSRFANSVNFQGEAHLPGNDLLARYPLPP